MDQTNKTERNIYQTVLRILLGAFLTFAGTGHLTWHRTEFLAQVPTWLPMNADLVVVLSGVVEIVLGLSLILLRKKQIMVGWVVALFFILIFPGNISQYVNGISAFGLDTDAARLTRLFFQPILIFWAIWSCGSLQDWKQKRSQK
ncbi:hypothetical protein P3G55_15670 [Leptospira sp. 96542]|nr:hypothetical protein [Leptospira sp. 96542]